MATGALAGTLVVAAAPSAAFAAVAAGGLGLYDDLYGDAHARGLRGHLAALRDRRVTTGLVKLSGLVVAAAVSSLADRRRLRRRGLRRRSRRAMSRT